MKLIKRTMTVNGEVKVFYHQKLELSTRKDTTNVYVESVTENKKKALVFHDDDEAAKMAAFLGTKSETVINKAEVINK